MVGAWRAQFIGFPTRFPALLAKVIEDSRREGLFRSDLDLQDAFAPMISLLKGRAILATGPFLLRQSGGVCWPVRVRGFNRLTP